MKNKIHQISIILSLISLFISAAKVNAQSTIYFENFDGATMSFPAGWSADTANGGWKVDSTNVDTIPGASGHQNIVISNATGVSGIYNLTSKSISTAGYDNISVLWDARLTKHFRDSGSTVQSFDFSTDGGSTWTNVPYTENPSNGNSFWYTDNGGSRIGISAAANNQSSVMFRWVVSLVSTSSGTYRIDDFNVKGTLTSGINEYGNQNAFKAYIDDDKLLHVNVVSSFTIPSACSLIISDITGRECFNKGITSGNNMYSLSDLKQGVYLIKIMSTDLLFTQKIVCN